MGHYTESVPRYKRQRTKDKGRRPMPLSFCPSSVTSVVKVSVVAAVRQSPTKTRDLSPNAGRPERLARARTDRRPGARGPNVVSLEAPRPAGCFYDRGLGTAVSPGRAAEAGPRVRGTAGGWADPHCAEPRSPGGRLDATGSCPGRWGLLTTARASRATRSRCKATSTASGFRIGRAGQPTGSRADRSRPGQAWRRRARLAGRVARRPQRGRYALAPEEPEAGSIGVPR